MSNGYMLNTITVGPARYTAGSLIVDGVDNIGEIERAGGVILPDYFPGIADAAVKATEAVTRGDIATATEIMLHYYNNLSFQAATNGSLIVVNSEPDILDIDMTIIGSGTRVWVNSMLTDYVYDSDSSLPHVPGHVSEASNGQGRWIRQYNTHPFWRTQDTWYIDETHGSDANNGSIERPIKTFDEFNNRVGADWVVTGRLNIWIVGDISSINWRNDVNNLAGGDVRVFPILGAPIHTGTTTSTSTITPSTNTPLKLIDTAVPDWNAYANKLVVIDGTTFVNIYKDLGSHAAQVSTAYTWWDGSGDAPVSVDATQTIGSGVPYAIYDKPACTAFTIDCAMPAAPGETCLSFGPYALSQLVVQGNIHVNSGFSCVLFLGMDLGFWFQTPGAGDIILANCVGTFVDFEPGSSCEVRGGLYYGLQVDAGANMFFIGDPMIVQFAFSTTGRTLTQTTGTQSMCVFDVSGDDAIHVTSGGVLEIRHSVWGANNDGFAFAITLGGRVYYVETPTLVGSGGDCYIGGVTKTYGELPFANPDNLSVMANL